MDEQKLQDLDPKIVEAIYTDLATMDIDLDDDPLAFGPKRLNNKVAEGSRLLSRIERHFTDVSRRMHDYRRAKLRAEAIRTLKANNLYTNDPDTRSGRSIADREAIANVKLKDEVLEIARLDACLQDLEQVMIVIKSAKAALRDKMGRLRDQIRLCQEETGQGDKWGRGRPLPLIPGRTPATAQDSAAVDDLLSELDNDIEDAKKAGQWKVEAVVVPTPPPSVKLLGSLIDDSCNLDLDDVLASPAPAEAPAAITETPVDQSVEIQPNPPRVSEESAAIEAFLDAPEEIEAPRPAASILSDEDLDRLLGGF